MLVVCVFPSAHGIPEPTEIDPGPESSQEERQVGTKLSGERFGFWVCLELGVRCCRHILWWVWGSPGTSRSGSLPGNPGEVSEGQDRGCCSWGSSHKSCGRSLPGLISNCLDQPIISLRFFLQVSYLLGAQAEGEPCPEPCWAPSSEQGSKQVHLELSHHSTSFFQLSIWYWSIWSFSYLWLHVP